MQINMECSKRELLEYSRESYNSFEKQKEKNYYNFELFKHNIEYAK